jgi:lipopolysaccharide export system permease protein
VGLERLKPPILYRYIFRESTTPFLILLFVFTGLLFLARALKLFELVVNRNITILEILILFSYIIPRFLEIALPMSLLLAIIIALGRLSSDSELLVMRSSGISIRQLVYPIVFLAFIITLFTLVISLWVRPWANHKLGLGLFEIAKKQASSGLIPGVFNDLGNLTIYARQITENGSKLGDVIIADHKDPVSPKVFIAKHGYMISDDINRSLVLQLWDGSLHESSETTKQTTYYEISSIDINQDELIDKGFAEKGKRSSEMYIGELLRNIAKIEQKHPPLSKEDLRLKANYGVELQERFVIPFSCICIAFLAMALGVQQPRGGKGWSMTLSLLLGILSIITFYSMLAFVSAIGQQGIGSPVIIMWAPNVVFLIVGYYAFKQIETEKWHAFGQVVYEKYNKLRTILNIKEDNT